MTRSQREPLQGRERECVTTTLGSGGRMASDSLFAARGSPSEPHDAAYMEALLELYRGRVERARSMASAATSAATMGTTAGSFTDLMAAAVIELITELPDFDSESVSWAQRITSAALQARRPAWAATARAVNACGLIAMGDREQALREIAAAEVELAQEESWNRFADPLGKPHATGAAHNNLGCALLLLRCYEEGAHHFDQAVAVSAERYGPDLAPQVLFDLYNRVMLHLYWAMDEESLGHGDRALEVAKRAVERLEDFQSRTISDNQGAWETAARVLAIGLDSILAPSSITSAHLHQLEEFAIGDGKQATYLASPILVIQARAARLLGEAQVAIGAAETADWLMGRTDPFTVDATLREAALAAPERYPTHDPTRWRLQRDTERHALYELLAAAGCSPFPSDDLSVGGSVSNEARPPGSSFGRP